MQLAIFLSTVLVTLIALAAAFVAYRESRAAESAESRIEKRLAALAGITPRVSAVEASFESLRLQHQRLHGKFHATLREWEETGQSALNAIPDTPPPGQPPLSAFGEIGAPCDNYAAAQAEGPSSEAARCMCAYCLAKRAERAQLREKARQLPSHAATVRAIESAS